MLSLIPHNLSHFISLSYQLNEEQAQFSANNRKDLRDLFSVVT